eukprot:Protomagalhaensia_sp_Gyna_25__4460@NODE_408_length_3535_cov_48_735984_g314_i0_p1_GENE_NODE_408_length_3535_cov_48_735984_g314_i0NODE_408_length_3535_cov_48_735984_g314_i0_p1_ORF_typecomplete_len367_score68_98Alpha_GJ/PF03229_13/0_0021Podoplanin/PF05808_11/0_0031Mucin15/PF15672_5/0_035PcrB/PF01884_17/0_2MGC24/PF05283_11/4AJAP1_PANP_C/PF15298_6/1_7e03AJAP1_PANP_C/PF15298_6/3_6_NODE_408_length_3535_cov_48_735984_g314_i014032503
MKFLLSVIFFGTGYGDDYVCPNTTLEVFVLEDGSLKGRYLSIFDEAIAMLNNYFPSLLVGRGLVGDKVYHAGYECYCHDWDLVIPIGNEFQSSSLKECEGGADLDNNSMEALGYVSGSRAGFSNSSGNTLKAITYISEQRGKTYESENNGATPSQYPNPDLGTQMHCPSYTGEAMKKSYAPIQQIVELIDAAAVRPIVLSPSNSVMHDFWVDMMYTKMGYANYAYVEQMSANLEDFKNRYVDIILELYCVWETTTTTTTVETTTEISTTHAETTVAATTIAATATTTPTPSEEWETTMNEGTWTGAGSIVNAVAGASAGLTVLGAAAYRKWLRRPSVPEHEIQDSATQEFASINREQIFDPRDSYT